MKAKAANSYDGFEQGLIRPPSEGHSLLLRVTRNCPWNRCSFCPVYKQARFSVRPVEHVKRDIDVVHKHVETLRQMARGPNGLSETDIHHAAGQIAPGELAAFAAALNWVAVGGMNAVFLQDADALATRPADLVEILGHLKTRFPSTTRITSYSRARTIAAKKDGDLKAIKDAGLTRLHVGLESGSDQVVKAVAKGTTKQQQIVAGQKAKSAGFELSEYVMPGLGGRKLSQTHAKETADALNKIDPDFIRFRTLAIPQRVPLFAEYQAGHFEKCTDIMVAEELLMLIEQLKGLSSVITSDHVVNLFTDLEGTLPGDKDRLIAILRTFLDMAPEQQTLYQVGRRLGIVGCIGDMEDSHRTSAIERACGELGISPQNVDQVMDSITAKYV